MPDFLTEGRTKLEVPELSKFRTPSGDYAPSLTSVFYNPHMEFSRDISISVAQVLARENPKLRICDPLAGVGARGLRYAKEVKGVSKVVVNDRSPEAVEFIRRNVEHNDLTEIVEIHEGDASVLLQSYRPGFHLVDVDPFGSPAPFVGPACSALDRRGALFATATDVAPLCGVYPKACVRRYGAKPVKTEYAHEIGIRILIGFCQRQGAVLGVALLPIMAHSTRHYFRVYFRAKRSVSAINEVLSQHGYISHCRYCTSRFLTFGLAGELPVICQCGGKFEHAGPLWLGRLMDKDFLSKVREDLAERGFRLSHFELELLGRCIEEADGPPTFYDVHWLAKLAKAQPKKISKIISGLRERGYFASRTHFSPIGIRTDAPLAEILNSF